MKKRIITLVAAAAAVALLAICYVAVSNMGNGGNAETTAPPPTSYTVAEIDRKTVYALGYTYEGKSYDLMLNEQMTGWNLKSNEALPISNTVMAYMIKQFEFMTSDFRLQSPSEEKLSEYGFDKPTAEIYFYDAKGRHGYTVGMLNTFNSMYYIRSTDDPSNVYLVKSDFMDYFTLDEMKLLQIYEIPAASLSKEITLEIKVGEDTLKYKYYPGGRNGAFYNRTPWFLSVNGGEEFPINEKISDLLSKSCAYLGYAECISYSEADVEKYGLSSPARVTVSYTNVVSTVDPETGETLTTETPQSHVILLGGKDGDGYSYAMAEGQPLIYVTVSDVYSMLYGFNAESFSQICSGYIVNAVADDISEVEFTVDGNIYKLTASESATGFDYFLNGEKISREDAKATIASFASIPWETDISKVPSATDQKSVLAVKLSDGTSTYEYNICAYSDEFYLVKGVFGDSLLIKAETAKVIFDAVDKITE